MKTKARSCDKEKKRKVDELAAQILKEEGSLTTREIMLELEKRNLAYSIVDGQRRGVSVVGLETMLSSSFEVKRTDNGGWEVGGSYLYD